MGNAREPGSHRVLPLSKATSLLREDPGASRRQGQRGQGDKDREHNSAEGSDGGLGGQLDCEQQLGTSQRPGTCRALA